jgi:quercetin dioxygenase-like cupin family protein
MQTYLGVLCVAVGFSLTMASCSKEQPSTSLSADSGAPTPLDLTDVTSHPERYTWFDFRPDVKKLILAGAPESEHIAILWYTAADGGVGLHYHDKTESVYVIDGSQTDAKGDYPSGTVYFNPPGSGHQVTHSTGFFLLAYAAAPDFTNTQRIETYTPVRMDLTASDLTSQYAFAPASKGVRTHSVPLEEAGGMRAELIELTPGSSYTYQGNYVLVLSGGCSIAGSAYAAKQLAVTNAVETRSYTLTAAPGGACMLLAMAFRTTQD